MAVTSRGRTEFQIPKKWKERETSPERTKVWTEPHKKQTERKVPVVYYLSRNGQLEHPHFMEVPLSSPDGLYLRDVINRLDILRGKGMASVYSWSSKRSYKNGFVWHDLSENDFIYPAHGQEYVLKGSELLLDGPSNPKSHESVASTSKKIPETNKSDDNSDFPVVATRRRNQSWSSIDLHEYKVYKTESAGESTGKAAADASTQTDDKRRRRRGIRIEEEEKTKEQPTTELSREEISPPPSDSSPETLESLMKADGRLVLSSSLNEDSLNNQTAENNNSSGRTKTSSVLMQLISCGSISFRDCGPTSVKDQGFSLISHYKLRVPRGARNQQMGKEVEASLMENSSLGGGVRLEDKEYFSGSLIETKKAEFPGLKRSSSYNADRRSSQLEPIKKEAEEVKAKCIPRRPKALPLRKKDSNSSANESRDGNSSSNDSQHGGKRLEFQQ